MDVYMHVYRHVYRHAYRHVCRHVCAHVFLMFCIDLYTPMVIGMYGGNILQACVAGMCNLPR